MALRFETAYAAREAVRDHRIPGTWNVYQGTIEYRKVS